jgi:hypothetical protein
MGFNREPIEVDRLIDRVQFYAALGGASHAATSQMADLLHSRLGQAVLHLPDQELSSLLVNDVYKIRMQNAYSQFMTGECCYGESMNHIVPPLRVEGKET